eukprot:CAMPEP_0194026066 /NCGR_PEP_ID=MMETSP0009_2-20130614/378_1 /TAXON_ID=210454 /ORGANISM="Grammatophora oceanica, Strain CCMP 410" /LENGTH=885 /DNA_ID=CAMNT_0038664561 /DNA_START=99 /DNA_END=2753 /DNA_ORIENTATION=-
MESSDASSSSEGSDASSSFIDTSRTGTESGVFSNASTNKFDNTVSGNLQKTAPPSPLSLTTSSMSRNSRTAALLLRSRKDRRNHVSPAASRTSTPPIPDPLSPLSTLSGDATSQASASDTSGRHSVPPLSPSSTGTPSRRLRDDAQARFQARMRKKGAAHRARVPGGAAAKIIGPAIKELDTEKYKQTVQAVDFTLSDELMEEQKLEARAEAEDAGKVKELDSLRQKTRHEFTIGSSDNKRYRPTKEEPKEETISEASMPSILNRSEVFHENATAAVLALLTPNKKKEFGDNSSVGSGLSNMESNTGSDTSSNILISPNQNGGLVVKTKKAPNSTSAFQAPRGNETASVLSNLAIAPMTGIDESESTYQGPRSPTKAPVLSPSAQKSLEFMKKTMKNPTKTLADLLTAIATPEDITAMDRGFMVRRKNACGAVKVLTATPANRRTMCWTVGVLTSMTSVLADTGDQGLAVAFQDPDTQREYAEARKRAVASLLNLCIPKENRIAIFHSAGLVQAVVQVVNDDKGESRQGSCAILAYLAKTQENRLLMVQVPGLLDALTSVIRPHLRSSSGDPSRKNRSNWDAEDDQSVSMYSDSAITPSIDRISVETDGVTERTDEDSEATPKRIGSPTKALSRLAREYDQDPNKFLHRARQNIFALFFHVVKEKDNAYALARHKDLMLTLVDIAYLQSSPSHVHAVKILAHLTRHKGNNKHIVFRIRVFVPAMVVATTSHDGEARKYATFAIQNLSQDKSCRQEVASTKGLLRALCQRARQGADAEERLASMSALKNLTDEPANLIPMTNTAECFATLMQIAHGHDKNVTDMMQYLACDSLATLSHWLRKIATSGQVNTTKESGELKEEKSEDEENVPPELFVPSLKVITYNQW